MPIPPFPGLTAVLNAVVYLVESVISLLSGQPIPAIPGLPPNVVGTIPDINAILAILRSLGAGLPVHGVPIPGVPVPGDPLPGL